MMIHGSARKKKEMRKKSVGVIWILQHKIDDSSST